MHRFRLTILRAVIATGLFVALWLGLTLSLGGLGLVDLIGWVTLYLMGLAWAVYLAEQAARGIETRRVGHNVLAVRQYWNPFDPTASYYGFWPSISAFLFFASLTARATFKVLAPPPEGASTFFDGPFYIQLAVVAGALAMAALASAAAQSQRLRQSLVLLATYSIMFGLVYFIAHMHFGRPQDSDGYELPAGGGSDTIKASSVKVQKVIRKKYVINPYSSVVFSAPPPLDQIDVKLTEETQNRFQVGDGDGATGDGDGSGSGFGSGTGKGKATFVRLHHGDDGWDRNFGFGGDLNMLREYGSRTKQKVAEETEQIDTVVLAGKPAQKAPSLLYICGSQSLPLSAADKKILRQYITERHGMILGDNHGGLGFHQHFIAMMNEITGVTPVVIARDDRIHQRPYSIAQLPMVVAHGPPSPLGWKIDGRWVVYYHPGALSDAWRDDHAGIKKDVYESCYQLGVNIIFYSLQEKNKWLLSQKP